MLSKLALVLGPLAVATAVSGPLLARFYIIGPMIALGFVLIGGLIGFAAIVVGITAAVRYQAYFPALIALLGLLPLLVVIAMVAQVKRYPLINDVTSNLASPLEFKTAGTLPENAGRDLSFPKEFVPIIEANYGDLAPLHMEESADWVYQKALVIAAEPAFRWEITDNDDLGHVFEAVDETRVFRWKDDIIVKVTPEGDGCVVNMRSKSRDGRGDFGANAHRIRRFFAALQD